MKRILSVIAFSILVSCVFNQILAAALGVSPFLLIGFLATLALACLWVAPIFERGSKADWRYEQRLVRRPGV